MSNKESKKNIKEQCDSIYKKTYKYRIHETHDKFEQKTKNQNQKRNPTLTYKE